MQRTNSKQRGIAAVEMLVGIGIVALILVFTTHAIMRFINTGNDIAEKTQALYLAEEALEVVRFLRDDNWDTISDLTNDTAHYLDIDSGAISITGTPEIIEGFKRSFYISDVYRDNNDSIVASTTVGSSADTSSKYVTAVISWGTPTSTVSLTTILGDIAP